MLVFLAYGPALHGEYVWDDDRWTTGVVELLHNVSGLSAMWLQLSALQQYYPLTGTSFWIDYHLWGFQTLPYHVENILLHALAAGLFWRLLQKLRVPGAWLAGALFALHPLMVESVAWITERKNVLSLVLYLGALLAYGTFMRLWEPEGGNALDGRQTDRLRRVAYFAALVLFLAAYLAKATAFSFPAVVLLLAWWKRERLEWKTDLPPTLPFFAMSTVLGLVTAWLEHHHVGAQGPEWAISFPARCLIAGRAFWFYLGKLIWPADLCFVYPRWQIEAGSPAQWLYPITAAGAIAALWLARRRIGRGPAAAILFYVGTLFPLLGFLNGYFMRYSFVCDHWVYLSSLGPIALAAALVARAGETLRLRAMIPVVAVIALPVLAILTWNQAHIYQDSETLWRSTLAKNPGAWLAYDNLGTCLAAKGQTAEAIECYRKSIRLNPDHAEVRYNLGQALVGQGRFDEAIEHYSVALRLDTNYFTHFGLGVALAASGRRDEGILQFRQAIQLRPGFAVGWYNLALALSQNGQTNEVSDCLRQALRRDPGLAGAVYGNANALAAKGRFAEAIGWYEALLSVKPELVEARVNLGNALAMTGRSEQAIGQYREALRRQADHVNAQNNLANLLASQGSLDQAATHYREAVRLDPLDPETHFNLGRVLVRQGQRAAAAEQFSETLRLDANFTRAQQELEALKVER